MEWLTNWDDLTHGTAVFSAAIPFLLVLGLAFVVPHRNWWKLCALALLPVTYWLFHFPKIPPTSSDDVVFVTLLAAVVILYLETATQEFPFKTPLRLLLRTALFAAIGWSIYPAWLATGVDLSQKLLIVSGFALSIALISSVAEFVARSSKSRLTLAVFIPPTVALAVLLQTGGSMRFAQVAGAMAAGLAALCFYQLIRKGPIESQSRTAALWAMIVVMLGWSGWLFAEVRYVLVLLLPIAPIFALWAARISALPRSSPFERLLWDTLASAIISIPIAVYAALQYAKGMAESEGY